MLFSVHHAAFTDLTIRFVPYIITIQNGLLGSKEFAITFRFAIIIDELLRHVTVTTIISNINITQ